MWKVSHREYFTAVLRGMILITVVVLCFSCASVQDMERKRERGDSIVITYDYHWTAVLKAVWFVYLHSSDQFIAGRRMKSPSVWWLKKDPSNPQKWNDMYTIPTQSSGADTYEILMTIGDVADGEDIAIFLHPLEGSKTRLEFVTGGISGLPFRKTVINRLIKESKFYLERGAEAYEEYNP